MQAYNDNITASHRRTLHLDAHGGVTGYKFRSSWPGREALHWRQEALRNDDTELKKQFDHDELEGLCTRRCRGAHRSLHWDRSSPRSEPDGDRERDRERWARRPQSVSCCRDFLFETRAKVPFVNEEKRLEPVDMHYPERVTDQVTYHLPDRDDRGRRAAGYLNVPWQGPCRPSSQERGRSRPDRGRSHFGQSVHRGQAGGVPGFARLLPESGRSRTGATGLEDCSRGASGSGNTRVCLRGGKGQLMRARRPQWRVEC